MICFLGDFFKSSNPPTDFFIYFTVFLISENFFYHLVFSRIQYLILCKIFIRRLRFASTLLPVLALPPSVSFAFWSAFAFLFSIIVSPHKFVNLASLSYLKTERHCVSVCLCVSFKQFTSWFGYYICNFYLFIFPNRSVFPEQNLLIPCLRL